MTALLSVQRASKRFRGLVAVDRVSFDVPEGAIFAVIGPNGAGKTTLFNMIAGAMAPNGGSIVFAGARIDGMTADVVCRRGIGRTFQIGAAVSGAERRGQCYGRRLAASARRRGARASAH